MKSLKYLTYLYMECTFNSNICPLYLAATSKRAKKQVSVTFFRDWWWILWLAVRQKTKVSHMCTWNTGQGDFRDEERLGLPPFGCCCSFTSIAAGTGIEIALLTSSRKGRKSESLSVG